MKLSERLKAVADALEGKISADAQAVATAQAAQKDAEDALTLATADTPDEIAQVVRLETLAAQP